MFSITSFVNLSLLMAEAIEPSAGLSHLGTHLIAVIVYSFVGVLVLGGCFWIMQRIIPFSVRKEIEEDQNIALGIIIGSVIVGMSIIIAAAIL